MPRQAASAAVSVERFFQFSLLGLVASGYLAVVGSGYLDTATIVLTATGLVLRGVLICGVVRLDISERAATLITIAYSGFYALDYFLLSREFLSSTVHLVFFLAVLKILTAKTGRDYLYTSVIAFLELLAAAILSINFNFFLFLALYLLFAMAALTSGEIRRSMSKSPATARSGLSRFHPRLAILSFSVTGGILLLTAGLFFILPRTADAALARLISHRIYLPGFSNQVTLGEFGEIKTSSRPVMHIQLFSAEPRRGLKWRGGALTDFDGKHWTNPRRMEEQLLPVENGLVDLGSAPVGAGRISYHVELEALETNALFLAGTPEKILLNRTAVIRFPETGTFRLERSASQPVVKYDAFSMLEAEPESAPAAYPVPVLPLALRERFLQTPPLDSRIPQLARSWTSGAISDIERARAIEHTLRTNFGYTLELPEHEISDPLAYFLFTRRKGHCEYFASAMAILLRTLGIPSRLATGFQSGIYNRLTDLWVVRASDAHTWVEAWIPGHGWCTFDPTPPDSGGAQFGIMNKLSLYLDAAETFWQEWVVSYDLGRQGSLMDRMEQGARRVGIRWFDSLTGFESNWYGPAMAWIRRRGLRVVIVLAMGVWIWFLGPPLIRLFRMRRRVELARRGQASSSDATLLYARMLHILKRHGYQKPLWFTPGEFAASLPEGTLGEAVIEFTSSYQALRFGRRTEVAPRLSFLLDELERQDRRG